ncbi:MAG TPA: hypothetical protein VJ725_20840 [Thermoanaerobaculia bacterium]|nr:hypothetical protein [Thermoanaerobaculia bacterium]
MTPDFQTAGMARRARRRRNELPVRPVIDSRLFRLLRGSPAALAGFRASLAACPLPCGEGFPPLELTPLGVVEVLGLEIPPLDTFALPKSVIRSGESFVITGFVAKLAKDFFGKAPALQAESFRKRVEELRETTDPAAHELFDSCLTRFVSREGFEDGVYSHLAFDFAYRYQFPDAVREDIFQFFAASLFAAGESVSAVSKLRVVKTLWDRSYERLLKKSPAKRAEIRALDAEMRLRTFNDYLDWEAVHYSILGYAAGERFHPVVAFTPDSEETLKIRCSAYKSALRAFLDQISPDELATTLRPRLHAWRPGWLVPVREDGAFDVLVSTGELPVF